MTASMSMGIDGFPGHCMGLLHRISLGEGIFEPMGVDCRSRSRSSRDILAAWLVLREVLNILTCHSMKPLDTVSGRGR